MGPLPPLRRGALRGPLLGGGVLALPYNAYASWPRTSPSAPGIGTSATPCLARTARHTRNCTVPHLHEQKGPSAARRHAPKGKRPPWTALCPKSPCGQSGGIGHRVEHRKRGAGREAQDGEGRARGLGREMGGCRRAGRSAWRRACWTGPRAARRGLGCCGRSGPFHCRRAADGHRRSLHAPPRGRHGANGALERPRPHCVWWGPHPCPSAVR